jgi:hypothetical protein
MRNTNQMAACVAYVDKDGKLAANRSGFGTIQRDSQNRSDTPTYENI